jgi:hypothetical protein
MALRKTKAQQGAITSINLKFSGGMNVSQPPASINDNELTLAMNAGSQAGDSLSNRRNLRQHTRNIEDLLL